MLWKEVIGWQPHQPLGRANMCYCALPSRKIWATNYGKDWAPLTIRRQHVHFTRLLTLAFRNGSRMSWPLPLPIPCPIVMIIISMNSFKVKLKVIMLWPNRFKAVEHLSLCDITSMNGDGPGSAVTFSNCHFNFHLNHVAV